MREEFSAWYLAEVTQSYGESVRTQAEKNLAWVRQDGSFADPMLRLACLAWQASREQQNLHPLQQTLRDNGELIAAQATVAQQAQMIEHLRGGSIACYTTSDIANADADGFKNGRKSVGLLLSKGFNTLNQVGGKYSITLAFQNADDAYAAYTEIATVVRLAGEA
ncbi:hypothetical protein JQF37_01705 [Pseudomonas sp. MIL9]|uniref:hypothetical protein n=1 Tax=Pseudomonas sp. MIL9 TaxID=2807620 RepID=UPI0019522203|nr:hypothetical protein [Pseudomonas sp. MIL9]MBM6442343.1 hypothetical protein [Pseudomonas sp. MIL9]